MYLVDEEYYLTFRLYDGVYHALEPFLKLTLVLRACHEGTHIEGVNLLFLQVLRHIAAHYALRQSLGNGGLARARLANEDGVVLRSARKNLQHTAYLVIPAYHGVKLASLGIAHKVLCKALQCLFVCHFWLVHHNLTPFSCLVCQSAKHSIKARTTVFCCVILS